MIKTFEDAVKFLEQFVPDKEHKFPGLLGFERMEYFAELLDNPQFKYPTIHVGGTAGKGSTATIIASILSQHYRVGLYTSPHLISICERIKIFSNNSKSFDFAQDKQKPMNRRDKENISEKEFINLVKDIQPSVEKMGKSKFGPPSYFEIVTAMSFIWFAKQNVDIAVIEVGLGGMYDATNVVKPQVAVVTNVGLDHTEVLGDTVEKIAQDKAGIIKSHIEVISGAKQSAVIQIINAKCKAQSAKLSLLNRDFHYKVENLTMEGSVFDYVGKNTYKGLKLQLLGEHQIENAALAVRTVEVLSNQPIVEEKIRKGLISAFIPGRMEIIKQHPLVMLDGAHNPDKMKALVSSVQTIFPGKKIICILAIKEDKNVQSIAQILLPVCNLVILTRYSIKNDLGTISSYDSYQLFQILKELDGKKNVVIEENLQKALYKGSSYAQENDFILITGSLYLIGEVKKLYEEKGSVRIDAGGRGHTHTV